MGRVPSRDSDQFNLRFPDGMRDQLKKLAEENGRSLNAEIVTRLDETLKMDGAAYDAAAMLAGNNAISQMSMGMMAHIRNEINQILITLNDHGKQHLWRDAYADTENDSELLKAIDSIDETSGERTRRSDVVKKIIMSWMLDHGYLRLAEGDKLIASSPNDADDGQSKL